MCGRVPSSRKRKSQQGATLLEALAFLGVAAIVIVGAIAMFRSAQGSAQSNDMIQQLSGLRGNIKTLYSMQARFGTGVSGGSGLNLVLISAKAVPNTLRYTGGTIRNSWGGTVRIDGDASSFYIRYSRVPQEVCTKVAPQTGASWQGLTINANPEVATDEAVFPVDTAVVQCIAGNINIMTWRGM